MKVSLLAASFIAAMVMSAGMAGANERYAVRPPVKVSPDLAAPWVMQLQDGQARRTVPTTLRQSHHMRSQPTRPSAERNARPRTEQNYRARQRQEAVRTLPAAAAPKARQERRHALDPKFLPQQVSYDTSYSAGTIVIDSASKFLYLVEGNGSARRYGVGVGKEGMGWTGTETVSRKAQWPDWRPPAQMIARERAKGRHLPNFMAGGPENPLGARALYLGSTLYRIHGTNAPWTIGTNVSSGCIRLRNEDVVDLYERVPVGAKVVVM